MQIDQCKTLDEFLTVYKWQVENVQDLESFGQMISHLIKLFQVHNIPLEAKNICFFRRWSEIKLPTIYMNLDFIHQLAELNHILSENLKEDLLLDFIWIQVSYDFQSEEILNEYFTIIKTFYYRNLTEVLRQFNMIDIVKLMLKITEAEGHTCCEEHNIERENKLKIIPKGDYNKIKAFAELIQSILQLAIMEFQRRKIEYEQIISISIHHLLSFCTKEHSPCQVLNILSVIIKSLLKLEGELISTMFQNYESVSFLIILYNQTEITQQKIMCIKIFHIISLKNTSFLQKIIVSIIPPSKQKKPFPWLADNTLFIALFEWVLKMKLDVKITDHLMFDEKLVFQISEVLELILSYLYIAPEMIRQFTVTTLFTLVKMNRENQIFLGQHSHFLNTFPKFLLSYQEPLLEAELNSIQKSVRDGDTIIFKIFDSSFRTVAAVFMQQLLIGRVDLLFQWQKLVQLEIFKIENEDNDRACGDARTPRLLLRTLYSYMFTLIGKSGLIGDQTNVLFQRGTSLFMASFLHMMLNDLFVTKTGEQNQFQQFNSIKYSAKIFIYKNFANLNDQWVDYQFLPKIISTINILTTNIVKSSNFEPARCTSQFKYQEFSLWHNNLFKKLLGNDKDNVHLLRILQTIIQFYANYIVVHYFSQDKLEDIINLLKHYRYFMTTVVNGALQLKQFKLLNSDVELQIKYTHYLYLELHMNLLNLINDRCSIAYTQNQDYFNHIEEKQTLLELVRNIKTILCEYYSQMARISLFYGQTQINFIWPYCYDLVRMRKQEGIVQDADLQILINQPDSLGETVISEEMIAFILDSPNSVDLRQKANVNINEILNWANIVIEQQEKETIILYQEQYSRQSQILMKDINQTLNKFQKIQQFNQDLFAQEKSLFDKSRTLSSLSSN